MPRIDAAPGPFWTTSDRAATVRLWLGDAMAALRGLPSRSAQCVVTSPPYWGLRSYDTADGKHLELGSEARPDCERIGDKLLALRDDLTLEEKEHVLAELTRRGVI